MDKNKFHVEHEMDSIWYDVVDGNGDLFEVCTSMDDAEKLCVELNYEAIENHYDRLSQE